MPDSLPDPIREAVEAAIDAGIDSVRPVGGGCINHGGRIRAGAADYFLKWNRSAPVGMFEAESDGLRALRAAEALRVPEPIVAGSDWLLLEWIAPGASNAQNQFALGVGLAQLHASAVESRFGWHRDNWIGSLPQTNSWADDWGTFWRDRRIAPQLRQARRGGFCRDGGFDRLLDLIPQALSDVETPRLLHGDLWGGNSYTSVAGEPVVIDPAVYLGDGEVDLAMSELFGGFTSDFYDAYETERGITSEYRVYRRDLYQLYYLLVHVNLFGASYEAGSLRAAERVLAEVG